MTPQHLRVAEDRLVWREGDFWLMTPAWEPAWDANPTPRPEDFDPIAGSSKRARAARRLAAEIEQFRLHDRLIVWRGVVAPSLAAAGDLVGCILVDQAPLIVTTSMRRARAEDPAAEPLEIRLPAGLPVLPIGAMGLPHADPTDLVLAPATELTIVSAGTGGIVAELRTPSGLA